MKNMKTFPMLLALLAVLLTGCDTLQGTGGGREPSFVEMDRALREALAQGTADAVVSLNKKGGYYDNPSLRILLPPEARQLEAHARNLGMGAQVDDLIARMNRAAEDAAGKARPIFEQAIRDMSIVNARDIVLGPDNAATMYFQQNTTDPLYDAFSPEIRAALEKVDAPRLWNSIFGLYNQLPNVEQVDTDMVRYVTHRALDGLFSQVELRELAIRNNFRQRSTTAIQRVFGWAEEQKAAERPDRP